MSEQLLFVLKLCLLALLYLFFFRVLRAVWAEIKTPAPVGAGAVPRPASDRQARKEAKQAGKRRPPQLVVVEPADQRGRAYAIGNEATVGRAAGCQITVDDNFVSQLHARVFARDGRYLVEDLGSTNGTYLNRRKVSGPMVISPGDRLQIGNTVLEMR